MTPFKSGQAAARAGQPRDSNPHPRPDAPATGDAYPGPWHNWDAGWLNATATTAHDRTLTQSLVDKAR